MPRLTTSLLQKAHAQNPLLPLLLRATHDLPSATNELRWLKEHAQSSVGGTSKSNHQSSEWQALLRSLCNKRASGVPLQYLIGNQPFGDLEILCRPGVLIPRSETEAWTTYTAGLISDVFPSTGAAHGDGNEVKPLRVLDICTGTGCIALLLHSLLYRSFPDLEIVGLDLSPQALKLARTNLLHNARKGYLHSSAETQVQFLKTDVLDGSLELPHCDIIVSNPPYISTREFNNGQTSQSVKSYEPRMALVPPSPAAGGYVRGEIDGDLFYPKILELGVKQGARLLVVEVGGLEQAKRVAKVALRMGKWETVEIWRDWVERNREPEENVLIERRKLTIKGEGNGRVVACWRAEGLPN